MIHWTLLLTAIIHFESGGDLQARGKNGELGPLQTKPIVVRDVNRIYGTKYKLSDRTDLAKSKEIFKCYTIYWMHALELPHTAENAARIWKEGPTNWRNSRAYEYSAKVLSHMRIEEAGKPVKFSLEPPDPNKFIIKTHGH